MYDLIIRGGTVIDGTGKDAFSADVAVKGERIVKIGDCEGEEAARVIDAAGRYVTPGFIDMHSHADLTVASFPKMENYIAQGTTTVFTGHCALGVAPIDKYYSFQIYESKPFAAVGADPIGGHIPGVPVVVETEKLRPVFPKTMGYELDWSTHAQFREHLRREGVGCNIFSLVSAGNIRYQVMGLDYKRPSTKSEIEEMKKILISELENGALGLDFGFDYHPNLYTTFEEAVELAKCLVPFDAIMTAHWQARNVRMGKEDPDHMAIDGVREFLEIGKASGARTHLSHLSISHAGGVTSEEADRRAQDIVDLVEQYKAQGLRVTFDVIPPDCAGPFCFPELAFRFLAAVKHAGGLNAFGEKVKTEEYRASLLEAVKAGRQAEIFRGSPAFLKATDELSDGDKAMTVTRCLDRGLEGKTIYEIAQEQGLGSIGAMLFVLSRDVHACTANLDKTVQNCGEMVFLHHPEACVGFDTVTANDRFDAALEDMPLEVVNSNTFNGQIKYLLRFGEKRLEDTIRRMTGRGAEILGLCNRGLLQEGYKADLVVLDPKSLQIEENPAAPMRSPSGVEYVFVNGEAALEKGVLTGAKRGQVYEAADLK